jgi:hypothetical protein
LVEALSNLLHVEDIAVDDLELSTQFLPREGSFTLIENSMLRRVAKDGDRTLSYDSVQESEPLATIAGALSNLLYDSVCCSTVGVLLDPRPAG